MPYKIVVHQTCKKVGFNHDVLSFGTKGAKERTKENAAGVISPRAHGDKGYAPLTGATSPVGASLGAVQTHLQTIIYPTFRNFGKD